MDENEEEIKGEPSGSPRIQIKAEQSENAQFSSIYLHNEVSEASSPLVYVQVKQVVDNEKCEDTSKIKRELDNNKFVNYEIELPTLKDEDILGVTCNKKQTETVAKKKMPQPHCPLCKENKTFTLVDKVKIKKDGRPIPELLNLKQPDKTGNRSFLRHFPKEIYKKCHWICGCDVVNALFCFPCVLFYSKGGDYTFSVTGFRDLKHLYEKIKKHEVSAHHMQCCTDLAMLDSVQIVHQLDSVYRQNIIKHNEQVTKNRYILKQIINCVKFCGKLELALDEKEDSETGILLDLIDFSSELDVILKEHLDKATVFKAKSRVVQNKILESMLAVCRQEIIEQISSSDFLSIQCDETTDISNQCQMVMIVRYYYSGNIYERFWTFFKVIDKSPQSLTSCIDRELHSLIFNSSPKLIAQTYDCTNVMLGGVHSYIKLKYKHAHLIHCYAHQLNLIMQKATSRNAKVKIFFSNLSAIPAFFSNSTHQCAVLKETLHRKLPTVAASCWNYNIQIVKIVYENREKLIECFEELEEKCNKTVTCKEAYSLRRILEDPDFIFFLKLFQKIFPHVNTLFHHSEASSTDSIDIVKKIKSFEQNILLIRYSSHDLEEEIVYTKEKRRKVSPGNKNSSVTKEVCDALIFQMKERLSYRGHVEAASLVNVNNFLIYSNKFPISIFKSVVQSYPMLQSGKLRTELEVIYSRTDFKNIIGALNMLSWLSDNGLNETFSETVKLLKIIVTTPMPTDESERCFSTLKRVKTFLRNTMDGERLNALAMMSINKNFIHNINNFDEKVIDHFIFQENRSQDFIYKQ